MSADVDIKSLQVLLSVYLPKILDEVNDYLLLDLEFMLEQGSEDCEWQEALVVMIKTSEFFVELLNDTIGVELLEQSEVGGKLTKYG